MDGSGLCFCAWLLLESKNDAIEVQRAYGLTFFDVSEPGIGDYESDPETWVFIGPNEDADSIVDFFDSNSSQTQNRTAAIS